MIRISLGLPGSGKTSCEVRNIMRNPSGRKYLSNIKPKRKVKHWETINKGMIVKKEQIGQQKNGKPVFKEELNVDFWKSQTEPLCVVLDEAHSIINARRAMSKQSILAGEWMALVRRVLGQSEAGYGELVFITQLPQRIDVIARELATQIRYHICYYVKRCKKCGLSWGENSEMPEPRYDCYECGSWNLKKLHHRVKVYHFKGISDWETWYQMGKPNGIFYRQYWINDIEDYFKYYDTLQWENLFSSE